MEIPVYGFIIILVKPHLLSDRKSVRIDLVYTRTYVFKKFVWYTDSDLKSTEANAHLFIDMRRL